MSSLKEEMRKDMKKKKKKPLFGFLGSKSKAYEEAQDALEEHDQMAQATEKEED